MAKPHGTTEGTKTRPKGAGMRGKAPQKPVAASAVDHIDEELDGTLTSARTATERRRAKIMEAELQRRMAELLPAAEVEKKWFALVRMTRNRLLGIAPRVASAAFGAKTPRGAQAAIDREIRLALESLANDIEHGRAE